jgi:aminodeoxyfutalosine synthase
MTIALLDRPRRRIARDPRLAEIARKVEEGVRLSREDGRTIFETPDLHEVCRLAHLVRRRLHGDVAYYNVNRHINYSNVCALRCSFCAFRRRRDEEGAYEMEIPRIAEEAAAAAAAGATELHIVGGLHPYLPFEFYTEMLSTLRERVPQVHLKAFTAVEIVHLQRISRRGRDGAAGLRAVLEELREAGLGSLPGGGAEVFDDRVHDAAFKGKIRASQWLEVHRVAHEIGLNSNATMLYGHVESREDRLTHLELLRQEQDRTLRPWAESQGISLQGEAVVLTGPADRYPRRRLPQADGDATGGGSFQTIIPLPFFPDGSELGHLPPPTGLENLRTLAVCRLMLDNIPHVKAFWIMQTLPMAELLLQGGADDVDGTVVWYDITHVGGAGTHQEVGVPELVGAIRGAGFTPVERDTLYRRIERLGDDPKSWRVAES